MHAKRFTRWVLAPATLLVVLSGLVAVPPAQAAGSAGLTASAPSAPVDTSPRFDQVWSMASHNSYYFAPPDFESHGSGPAQHLLDDLYSDRMKSLEFDLHPDPGQKDRFNPEGRWGVFHTNMRKGESTLCTFLNACLDVLRAYHFANPTHDPVIIRLEAKGTGLDFNTSHCPGISTAAPDPGCLFQDGMTPQYLDETLTKHLHDYQAGVNTPPSWPVDDWIFGPKDYYQWCQGTRLPQLIATGTRPAGTTLDLDNLKDAVKKCGWPTLHELQGKFIVNLFGSDPILGLTQNAISVDLYSHGYGRRIADAKIFPEASVLGSNIINNNRVDPARVNLFNFPECPSGVCDWNDHTVFAQIAGDLQAGNFACTPPPERQAGYGFPCYRDPTNGGEVSDPGLTISNFMLDGGIVKSSDVDTQAKLAANLAPINLTKDPASLGGTALHGYNSVDAGDAPRNMVVNFRPGDVATSTPVNGPLNWSYGCLWDGAGSLPPGCLPATALSEQHSDIFVRAYPVAGQQLTDHAGGISANPPSIYANDNLVFLSVPRTTATAASLRAFVSTRRARNADNTPDFGATNAGNLGCLMARADTTDPQAPFFALCRYGHRNGGQAFGQPINNEGLYTFYRLERHGQIFASYSDANPHPTGQEDITHQGQWELQPSLRIQPDQAGVCWSGFTRTTDDPSPTPGWGEVSAGPGLCFHEALNFVGLATDGGREARDGGVGEYNFANVRYNGNYLTTATDRATHLTTAVIGSWYTPVVEDRSFFGHLTVEAPSPTLTYGQPVPASFSPIYAGLTPGDSGPRTPSVCTTTAQTGSGAGTYPVTCTYAVDPYYSVSTTDGVLVILPAPLKVQAPSATAEYGDPVPAGFTPTYSGLVNGDTAPGTKPTCTTSAHAGSDAGAYPISCTGAADPNYFISYLPGTFTVTQAATTLKASTLTSSLFHPRATLKRTGNGAPIAGQTIAFTNGTTPVCSALTNSSGIATCANNTLIALNGFTAAYAGTNNYLPSRAAGTL